MRVSSIGEQPVELDTTVTHIDVWYDLDSTKTWYITRYNKAGDQVGESWFTHHKRDAVAWARTTQEEWGGADKITLTIGKRDGSY